MSIPSLYVGITRKDGKLTPALNRAVHEGGVIALNLTLLATDLNSSDWGRYQMKQSYIRQKILRPSCVSSENPPPQRTKKL